ncbi:MAG TPA: hypothetical protein VF275_03180 [Gammaproteobacteria bacterium]
MTTIAYRSGVLAADSQGTSSFKQRCQKIHKIGDSYFGIEGSLTSAYLFLEWLKQDRRDWVEAERNPPSALSDDDSFGALELCEEGLFLWDGKLTRVPVLVEFYAVGSGCDFAMGAMAMGADAMEAVKVAKTLDPYTGGAIKKAVLK